MKVDGTVDKFKARLVIQGFRQKEGIDYLDTYAPVARITTIRLLLALAAIHNLVIHQMDVKTAFLNGDLAEEWNQKFDEVVLLSGFHLNQSDKTDQNQVDKTKKFLSSKFSMKDMGEAHIILGIKIKRENIRIVITQSHYIKKILKKFNREDCSSVSTPMDLVEKLKPNTGKPVDQLEYLRAIGSLMYAITSIRPDIAYVVGRLSRFTSNPSRQYWQEITRVFKYLKGTMNYGLSYVEYPSVLEVNVDCETTESSNCAKSRPKSKNAKVRVNTEESAVKPEPELKNTIGCNLNPSDGPGKPNSIIMKTVKTKWALNQFQQPICVQLTKTVKTLKAQS
ncbi:zinc finger, CCHC-type containing protein [Tanacetum coccineum]